MLRVATGIILNPTFTRILLTQRGPLVDYPLTWETPGGKATDGESLEEALQRELHEEIGVSLSTDGMQRKFERVYHKSKDIKVEFTITFFQLVLPWSIKLSPAFPFGWFSKPETYGLSKPIAGRDNWEDIIRDMRMEGLYATEAQG